MNWKMMVTLALALLLGGCAAGTEEERVRCKDGTWSTAVGKQGACSHHGGVA